MKEGEKLKKFWNMKVKVIPTIVLAHETFSKGLNQRKDRDHPDHSTAKISQDTLKSAEDPRFVVTQPPVKNHLRSGMKNSQGV